MDTGCVGDEGPASTASSGTDDGAGAIKSGPGVRMAVSRRRTTGVEIALIVLDDDSEVAADEPETVLEDGVDLEGCSGAELFTALRRRRVCRASAREVANSWMLPLHFSTSSSAWSWCHRWHKRKPARLYRSSSRLTGFGSWVPMLSSRRFAFSWLRLAIRL